MASNSPALVVAAHGSRAKGWAHAVAQFAEHVAQSPGVTDALSAVVPAFLEAASPSIPTAVTRLFARGASRVLVAPLFLTVSAHVGEDLPGVLGMPVPEHVSRRIRGEAHQMLEPGLPVTLLSLGPLEERLTANVQRRLSLRTDDPSEDAVVVVAYGSTLYHSRWEELLTDMRRRLMTAGFGYAGYAFVGHVVGMSPEPCAEAIVKAGRMAGIRRVHVIPLLMGVTELQTRVIPAACQLASPAAAERGFRIVYAPDAILPDGDLAAHVANVALRELGVFPTAPRGVLA